MSSEELESVRSSETVKAVPVSELPNAQNPLSPKQIAYRDARITGEYDQIWQTVGKCCFCDMRERYIIHEKDGVVLTISLFAYIDGHMLIVPRRHIRGVKEFTPKEWEAVRELMYIAQKIIRKVWGIKGVQFIQKVGATAQSSVNEHIHYHCVPFDAPDLSVWNYRQMKLTPLQNAQKYQDLGDKLTKLAKRFEDKYTGGEGKDHA
ncbi:HIT domain-containing protein [Candidatus Saccharibacteria bacterium]|nr:HIT domain-containing protein [Candidatus Saccharibacteria bacterium]